MPIEIDALIDKLAEPEIIETYTIESLFPGTVFELHDPLSRKVWQNAMAQAAASSYGSFLKTFWGDTPGDIKDFDGNILEIAEAAGRVQDYLLIQAAYLKLCRRSCEAYLAIEPGKLDSLDDRVVLALKTDIEDKLIAYAEKKIRELNAKANDSPKASKKQKKGFKKSIKPSSDSTVTDTVTS